MRTRSFASLSSILLIGYENGSAGDSAKDDLQFAIVFSEIQKSYYFELTSFDESDESLDRFLA
jgi:hypothetical protein